MTAEGLWKFFCETGDVVYYILYKWLENEEECGENNLSA